MGADHRAGDRRVPADLPGDLREAAEHRPDHGGLALLVVPRVEVVGDPGLAEADLLGPRSELDDAGARKLLGGEENADL